MDRTTEQLIGFALEFAGSPLPRRARAAAVDHFVDTVAVALAGTTAEASRLAATYARASSSDPGATIIGHGRGSTPELAAFANAVMVRTYDWNDGMQAKAGGHPSDMIAGLLAVAETCHRSGSDLVVALALAYELLGGLGVATDRVNFDQGLFMGAATAVACGVLLQLDERRLGHAASLAVSTALPLGVHRWGGALAMTKGASTAFAVKNGVFCAQLAAAGFTSVDEPVEGRYGVWDVTGRFSLTLPVCADGPSVVEMSHLKPMPAESQVLGLLDRVPSIRQWASVDEIESIEITMAESARRHVADPAKYDPHTRETADHSLPYMLAVALVDGGITLDSYRPERFLDPTLRPIMNRIRTASSAEFDAVRAELDGVTRAHPVRAVFRTHDGRTRVEDVRYHKGHYREPMTRLELDEKFALAVRGVVDDNRRDEIRDVCWDIEDVDDVNELTALLAELGPPTSRGRGSTP